MPFTSGASINGFVHSGQIAPQQLSHFARIKPSTTLQLLEQKRSQGPDACSPPDRIVVPDAFGFQRQSIDPGAGEISCTSFIKQIKTMNSLPACDGLIAAKR